MKKNFKKTIAIFLSALLIVGAVSVGATVSAAGINVQVTSLDNGSGVTITKSSNFFNRKIVTKRIEGTGAYYSDWDGAINSTATLTFNRRNDLYGT